MLAVGWRQSFFLQYARLYPEYDFVFFGDNGQGDVFAAESMVDDSTIRLNIIYYYY